MKKMFQKFQNFRTKKRLKAEQFSDGFLIFKNQGPALKCSLRVLKFYESNK